MNALSGEHEPPALHEKLALAKTDRLALNRFIGEYMPFIKKCAGGVFFKGEARRENLSEAMLGFIKSVHTYKAEYGAFIPFAQTVIRNRLIDAARREMKIQKPLFSISPAANEKDTFWEHDLAQRNYDLLMEQENLRMEITDIDAEFSQWGFACFDLARDCPKQERSRRTCHRIARKVLESETLTAEILRTRKVPVKYLADSTGISEKVIEKYRRYIAAIIVIIAGNYPYMHTFLPCFFDQEELP
jgi:RNA polymerase sigma factor